MRPAMTTPRGSFLEVPIPRSPGASSAPFSPLPSPGASSGCRAASHGLSQASHKRSSLRSASTRKRRGAIVAKPPNRRVSVDPYYEDKALEPPQLPTQQADAWQLKSDTVMQRVISLFNCYTMADIVFHCGMRQLPAHKFVLTSASPVLYQRLTEAVNDPGSFNRNNRFSRQVTTSSAGFGGFGFDRLTTPGGDNFSPGISQPQVSASRASSRRGSRTGCDESVMSGGHNDAVGEANQAVHVEVADKYEDFYELMRYLYTDQVGLSLKNVAALVFMSDEFKLPALSEKSLVFLRQSVKPETCLKILSILRVLMSKAVLRLWKDVLDRAKALKLFKELSLAERQRRIQAMREGRWDDASSMTGSVRSVSRRGSKESALIRRGSKDSVASMGFSEAASSMGMSCYKFDSHATEVRDFTGLRQAEIMKLTSNGRADSRFIQFEKNLYQQIALTSEELSEICWRNVREHTEVVLAGDDWVEQSPETIRSFLSMDTSSVPEAVLFRALNKWVEYRCRQQGFPVLPEFRRKVLGPGMLEMVRFPIMKHEELLWEVVPTGLLGYEELRNLQSAVTKRSNWLPQYNGEARLQPLAGLVDHVRKHMRRPDPSKQEHGDDKAESNKGATPKSKLAGRGGAYGYGSYAPVKGDELDAILGAHLWRSHVENFVEEQEEMGLAHEAGVPMGSELDVRPVICGNLMEYLVDRRDHTAAHRQAKIRSKRHGAVSPMQMMTREVMPEAPKLPTSRAPSALGTPRGSQAPATARERGGGQALPPVRPDPTLRASSALGQIAASAGRPPSALLGQADGPGATAPVAMRQVAAPADFERIARGLYRFRGEEIIELRLVDGQPFAYSHGLEGDLVPKPKQDRNKWSSYESFGETEVDDSGSLSPSTPATTSPWGDWESLSDREVRRRLGIRADPIGQGVPLDCFIFNA